MSIFISLTSPGAVAAQAPIIAEVSLGMMLLVVAMMGIFTIVFLYIGYRAFFRKRLIENVPTSKAQGVTMGLNVLKGTAYTHRPLRSYLSEESVVYYSFTIEEQWKKTVKRDGKKQTKKGWRTIKSATRFRNFEVRDETGSIRVNPKDADFEGDKVVSKTCRRSNPLYYGKGPRRSIKNSTGRRRFREEIVLNNQDIYVMGDARVREDIAKPEIAHDEMGDMFLISSHSEDKLVSKFAWRARGMFFGAFIFALVTPPVLALMINDGAGAQQISETMMIAGAVGAGLSVLAVIFALYLKTVFNGLVDLRNRAQRAWSMLDVEFKRRHDLIPGLVNIVQAVADHEKETLAAVAQARSQTAVGNQPGTEEAKKASSAIDEQSSALGSVFAVAEAYPELKADSSYRKLMEELTRCEEKIALARGFYNDTVERVNNRVHTFPDMLLAGLAGTEEEEFLNFQEFEKKPIEIDLTPDDEEDDEEFGESFEESNMEDDEELAGVSP